MQAYAILFAIFVAFLLHHTPKQLQGWEVRRYAL